ncbi:MAG: hypothetical protein ACRDL0_10635 [Thermoleophilaceae bacterium]
MRRLLLVSFAALLTQLALAPAAAAKGPHASVSPGPTGIEPGRPWVATLTLFEFNRGVAKAEPTLVFRSGERRFAVRPTPIGAYVPKHEDVLIEARYRLRVVFPRAGRWSYTVIAGSPAARRFRFPAVTIGGGAERVTWDQVAFAGVPPHRAEPLPQKVFRPAAAGSPDQAGGSVPWIPAAGLTLAGIGTLAALRRRRRAWLTQLASSPSRF